MNTTKHYKEVMISLVVCLLGQRHNLKIISQMFAVTNLISKLNIIVVNIIVDQSSI